MSVRHTKLSPKADNASTDKPAPDDHGKAQLQKLADEAAPNGYFGTVPDDDTDYTVAGVTRKAQTARKDAPR